MRRLLLLIIAVVAMTPLAFAQTGLNIDKIFGSKYKDDSRAVETFMQGSPELKKHKISLYRSLTLTNMPEEAAEIEAMVIHDGAKALQKEVSYRDGKLHYGLYELPPVNKLNRYIFYLNQTRGDVNRILVIYIEGTANGEYIRKMLK